MQTKKDTYTQPQPAQAASAGEQQSTSGQADAPRLIRGYAYHEAGHAVLQILLKPDEQLLSVSIIPDPDSECRIIVKLQHPVNAVARLQMVLMLAGNRLRLDLETFGLIYRVEDKLVVAFYYAYGCPGVLRSQPERAYGQGMLFAPVR